MKEVFAFEFDWLPGEYGSDVDQCTAADLGVRVDDIYFTELEDLRAKTVRQRVRVSANVLALWLAGNWWRLRWETERSDSDWRMSHCMAAAGGGHVWPNLFFCGDGETVRLNSIVLEHGDFPVHYLRNVSRIIPVADFEAGVERFIEAVVARLLASGVQDAELIVLWREVQKERLDPVLAHDRKMEALLGFDADEAPEMLMREMDALSKQYGTGSIEEIATACGTKETITRIETMVKQGKSIAQPIIIPAGADIRADIPQSAKGYDQPWERAGMIAHRVRNAWKIGCVDPISTEQFSEIVKLDQMDLTSPGKESLLPMSMGFRSKEQPDVVTVALNKKPITSRRFALARIIGDNLYAKQEDQILPATQAATARQKFQRAFAQELLCPFEGLMSVLGTHVLDDDAMEDAAAKFEVSPLLVKTTLVNKGMLERGTLMDLKVDNRL